MYILIHMIIIIYTSLSLYIYIYIYTHTCIQGEGARPGVHAAGTVRYVRSGSEVTSLS